MLLPVDISIPQINELWHRFREDSKRKDFWGYKKKDRPEAGKPAIRTIRTNV